MPPQPLSQPLLNPHPPFSLPPSQAQPSPPPLIPNALRDAPATTACLEGAWVAIVGGSNAMLMGLQLANTLAPGTLHPTRTPARTFDTDLVDVVFVGGRARHVAHRRVLGPGEWRWRDHKAAVAGALAQAPRYTPRATRVTVFLGQYWPNVETAMELIREDAGWAQAAGNVMLVVQVPFAPPSPSPPHLGCAALVLGLAQPHFEGRGGSLGHGPGGRDVPPPPCISYALVQATVGVGTVLIWDLILIQYQT